MGRDLPVLEPTLVLQDKGYREVLIREMDAGKIPLSLGKKCPVECTFCYELDHSYRETQDPPKTTQDDWEFILNYIKANPNTPNTCLLYTSPSPRDRTRSRMPSSA